VAAASTGTCLPTREVDMLDEGGGEVETKMQGNVNGRGAQGVCFEEWGRGRSECGGGGGGGRRRR
jgi:hypothetical protein